MNKDTPRAAVRKEIYSLYKRFQKFRDSPNLEPRGDELAFPQFVDEILALLDQQEATLVQRFEEALGGELATLKSTEYEKGYQDGSNRRREIALRALSNTRREK